MQVEYALSISQRNRWVSQEEFPSVAKRLLLQGSELYRSLFLYPDATIKDHLRKNQTIAGYSAEVCPDHIIIDIDRQGDYSLSIKDTKLLINRLIYELDMPQEAILVYFSGSKGFHVMLHKGLFNIKASIDANDIVNALVRDHLCQGITVDPIYSKSRLVRVANSVNKKSNLFKIPISHDELHLSWEELSVLAKEQRFNFDYSNFIDSNFQPILQREILEIGEYMKREKLQAKLSGYTTDFDPIAENVRKITCVHNIVNAGPTQGNRHLAIGVISSSFRRQGIPMQATVAFLDDWLSSQSDYSIEKIKQQVLTYYKRGYRPGCQGDNPYSKLMQLHCDDRCMFFKGKDLNRGVMPIDDALPRMEERLKIIANKRYIDLGEILSGNKSNLWILPGMLITILAPTSVGKTAFIQWLQLQLGLPVNYLSLEMDYESMLIRFGQMIFGMDVEDFSKYYLANTEIAKAKMSEYLHNLNATLNSMDVSQIWDMVEEQSATNLVIDHIGLLFSTKKDERTKIKEITSELRKLAVQRQTIVWAISHVRRQDARDKSVNIYSGIESGSIENDSHLVLAIQGDKDDDYREIEVLKNTLGPVGMNYPMSFDRNVFRWYPTTRREK